MEILSILSIVISIISVCITGLIYLNAKESIKQSRDKYLYELRLNALKATKEVEKTWQTLISDVYHEKERINKIENNLAEELREMFENVESGLLKPSLENIIQVREKLEKNFDNVDEEEAKIAIRTMDVINIGLRQNQEESMKRYQLLYNKLRETQS